MSSMNFPELSEQDRITMLEPPTGRVRMVLDTDTYNEIDDQFAIVYSLLSPEKLDVEAIYAAPFTNYGTADPGEGMRLSYEEILRVLQRINVASEGLVFEGATDYLKNRREPEPSAAALDLVERAMAGDPAEPLYVAAIGAITNVASAILIEPEIINRMVVVWLGGDALHWEHAREFNLQQDITASQLIFNCGVPLVHVPCDGVTTHLMTTVPEMERYVKPHGAIGEYLFEIFCGHSDVHFGWSKEIWDISTIAYLINPGWLPSHLVHSPILTRDLTWSFDHARHFIRSVYRMDRDEIFRDLFRKLEAFNQNPAMRDNPA